MIEAAQLIASAWLLWCALQVLRLLAAPLAAPLLTRGAVTNGLWIVVHQHVREKLTADELAAVIAHENGHRHHLHAFENLALACCFVRRSPLRAHQQELEADDWAAQRGHGRALASAILKLSRAPLDRVRADRLIRTFET